MTPSSLIIAIAGPSCGGKTLLARALAERLRNQGPAILPLDAYYRDLSHLPLPERARGNFDAPDALDADRLIRDFGTLVSGEDVRIPVYDFAAHTRTSDSVLLPAGACVIVEGVHALYWPEIRESATLRVFVAADEGECLRRRILRDTVERGRTEASVRAQFEQTVMPMYRQFVGPARRFADLVLDSTAPVAALLEQVMAALPAER